MGLKELTDTRAWSIFLVEVFFLSFYVINLGCIYLILTLNYQAVAAVLLLIIVQAILARRNKTYIELVKTYMKPTRFFRKFDVIYETDNLPKQKVMFAYTPHAVFSMALISQINSDERPLAQSIHLGSRFILNSPVHGLLLQWWGIQGVNGKNMNKLMEQHKNIALVPGGYEQATITTPKALRVFIKKRKGFIKMALKKGYHVVPVVVLGEHQMYQTVDRFRALRLFVNKFKMPGVIHYSRFGVLPDPEFDVTIVVGNPIQMPTLEKPTHDELNYWHGKFIEAVLALYEKYKHLNNNLPIEIH